MQMIIVYGAGVENIKMWTVAAQKINIHNNGVESIN